MKILAIIAHPHSTSYCHQILEYCLQQLEKRHHQVKQLDLYAINFNPLTHIPPTQKNQQEIALGVESVDIYLEQIKWADAFLFIYPLWWWDRPAILKGWFDYYFRWGIAVNINSFGYRGLFNYKRAIVFQTSSYSQGDAQGLGCIDVMQEIMRTGTLGLCGIQVDSLETFFSERESTIYLLDQVKEVIDHNLNIWI